MKIYKTKQGIVIEFENRFYLLKDEDWDSFINDDNLYEKVLSVANSFKSSDKGESLIENLEAPINSQEIWASGVTYLISKVGRQEESKNAGGGDFYARVYEAERPELFFKATRHRTAKPGGMIRIRKDSAWNVPEPELTLVVTSSGKIVGYTIGNDMSSRSIEGENPLYLPQAKTYDGCAAIGPCIFVSKEQISSSTVIQIEIKRKNELVFKGEVELSRMHRKLRDLVSFLFRECSFPKGCFLMTGTGIVPTSDFTLESGDEIIITIEPIGTLINTVE